MQRRRFLTLTTGAVLAAGAGARLSATAGERTAADMEGPFYPVVEIPLRQDLIGAEDVLGDELRLSGQVSATDGRARSGVRIELWQCDANRVYRHPRAPDAARADPAFLGFGAQETDERGRFTFRTIVPVPYSGRPPHIHIKLWQADRELLTTQLYVQGYAGAADRRIDPLPSGDVFDATFEFVV